MDEICKVSGTCPHFPTCQEICACIYRSPESIAAENAYYKALQEEMEDLQNRVDEEEPDYPDAPDCRARK